MYWKRTAAAIVLIAATCGAAQSLATETVTVLNREQAAAIMPATVFYRGQTANIQGRNSAGLRIGVDKLVLAAVVDTSGYSTAVQQKYQAYLITEVPLFFPAIGKGSVALRPGTYGFGFLPNDRMVILDVGGNDVLTASTTHDAGFKRPSPLQIVPAADGTYNLYMGRTFVSISLAGYK